MILIFFVYFQITSTNDDRTSINTIEDDDNDYDAADSRVCNIFLSCSTKKVMTPNIKVISRYVRLVG